MSEKPGRYQRSTGGLIGAMLVALAVVIGFVVFRDLNRADVETEVKAIDYHKSVEYGREQVDFPLLAPESLPEGWKATSARVTPQPPRWHLGVLTDEGRYVGLEQSRTSERRMVERYVDPQAVAAGRVTIAGKTWRTWTDEGGDNALSRVEDGVTTVVVGTPGKDVLVDYVASLG